MKLNQLDAGGSHPWPEPKSGQTSGTIFVEGAGAQNYARGNSRLPHSFPFWVRATAPIGGAAAGSAQALKYLLTQLHELVKNPDLQPVYLQPLATDESGAYSAASEFDGWYWLDGLDSPHRNNVNSGILKVTLQATPAGPATVRRVGQAFFGGALASSYSGTPVPWVAFPVNSTPAVSSTTRTGSDGVIPVWINPLVNPAPFGAPPTVADMFKGRCHVYDTMTGGGNAVPTNGAAFNTNWVEVFGPEHVFSGDMVVTNGLWLLLFAKGSSGPCLASYFWNTALGTIAWQSLAPIQNVDNAGTGGNLTAASLERLGAEEVQLKATTVTSGGNVEESRIRLQRGAYGPRIEFRPQSQSNTSVWGLYLASFAAGFKILYNSQSLIDAAKAGSGALPASTDYGYAAGIIANSSYPFLAGMLWQNPPAGGQPYFQTSATRLGVGDTAGPGQNFSRQYGVFAIPLANPQNYQAEAESGSLGTGWSSTADVPASGGAVAKAASGSTAFNRAVFGTVFSPPAGTYDVWFRLFVTSIAGSAAEMKLGLWDPTAVDFLAGASNTYKANQASVTYVWIRVLTGAILPGAHASQFAAQITATLGTDWFIDEAVLVPTTNGVGWPRDLFQQFLSDRRVELSLA